MNRTAHLPQRSGSSAENEVGNNTSELSMIMTSISKESDRQPQQSVSML